MHPELSTAHAPWKVWVPKLVQSSEGLMTHSESISLDPALVTQSPAFPWLMVGLRTRVAFCVAFTTPATANPEPGSAPNEPNTSTMTGDSPVMSKSAKASSPLLKYWYVMSATAKIKESACGCAMM